MVFTVKKKKEKLFLLKFYGVFCDFRSIVLIQYVKIKNKKNCTMAKSIIIKNGQLYPEISDFTTNLNIPDVPLSNTAPFGHP